MSTPGSRGSTTCRSDLRKDRATNARPETREDAASDEPNGGGGTIVTIEQGRERRARRNRTEPRPDRFERRERRRTGSVDLADAAGESDDLDPSGATIDAAVGPAGASGEDQSGAASAVEPDVGQPRRGVLSTPVLAGAATPRTIDRVRLQLEDAERAVANAPEVAAMVAPLVRHVNTVTDQLNDAQITVGRLMAERDALRLRLAEAEGVSVEEVARLGLTATDDGDPSGRRLQRIEAREFATHADERKKPNPLRPVGVALGFVPAEETFDGLKRMSRRRRIFVASLLAVVTAAILFARSAGMDFGKVSRDSLADIAFVGPFFQAVLMGWMAYRIVRVGSKGMGWLFPDPNGRKKRR